MNDPLNAGEDVHEPNTVKVPVWFWIVSILALLWFLMDVSAFVMRVFMLDSMGSEMPEAHRNLYLAMPAWVNVVFALEVFGGLFGSVSLIVKKKWALNCFIISIIGVLAQTIYVYFLSEAISVMGIQAVVMPLIAIIIGTGLIYFSTLAIAKQWIP